jgi:hypothetical protein
LVLKVPNVQTSVTVNQSQVKMEFHLPPFTLSDTKNNVTFVGKPIRFCVNCAFLVTDVTKDDGVTSIANTIPYNMGVYSILSEFTQETTYACNVQ